MIIVIILSIGIILVIYSILGLKKENGSFENILDNSMENFKDKDFQIGALRKEMAETIMELQKDIITLKEDIKEIKNLDKIYTYDKDFNINFSSKNNDNIKSIKNNKHNSGNIITTKKVDIKDQVNELLEKGYSIEKISNELNVGKGEILLIRDLNTK